MKRVMLHGSGVICGEYKDLQINPEILMKLKAFVPAKNHETCFTTICLPVKRTPVAYITKAIPGIRKASLIPSASIGNVHLEIESLEDKGMLRTIMTQCCS